jgi:hypothetical protein
MYEKNVMTCFKYQVYLYGSEAITLNSVEYNTLSGCRVSTKSYQASPTLHYRQPSPHCMAAEPSPIWKCTSTYG